LSNLVHTTDLRRQYGDIRALDGVSLTIPAGQIVGMLGPNGAGKTTLIDLLVGLRRPTSGTVGVCGGNPRHQATRTAIGVTPRKLPFPTPGASVSWWISSGPTFPSLSGPKSC